MKITQVVALGVVLVMNAPFDAAAQKPTTERWLECAAVARPFQVATGAEAWIKQQAEVRATLNELLGRLPPRPEKPAVTVLKRENRGDYFLEKFEFDNAAGAIVPGYLLLPKKMAGKSPALLYCHWHGGQYDIGKEELFGTNATPVAPGPELARRGYAVVAVDAYCFGERNGRGPGGPGEKGSAGEMTASKFNLWVGRSLWGMMLRDDLMALDYLRTRPEVDVTRIGATGISMGATRTWWLMALDERLKAAVAVCCLTRYEDLVRAEGLKYHGIYYFVPGMLNHFDTEAVVSLAAPRPLLFLSGELDAGSPVAGIKIIETVAGQAYKVAGAPDNLQSVIYPGVGHQYTPDMWHRMLAWFDTRLK